MNGFLANPGIFILLLIFVLSLVILGGYGVYKVTRTGTGEQPEEGENEEFAADSPPPKDDNPSGLNETPKFKPPNRRLEEVAHLWRDPRDGRLIFQIGDESYKRGTDLTPRERQILLKVVMDFYRWLEPPSPVKPSQTELQTAAPSELSKTNSLMATAPEELPEKPRGFSPTALIADALQSAVPAPPLQLPSIVVQIDEILQEKLKEAEMQKWAVRLVEFPDRGMVVLVGLEQYEGIDDVPYKSVQQIIRAAVAEWEARVTEQTSE